LLGSVGEKDDWVVWYRDAVKGGKYGSIGLVRIVLWWLRFYFIKKTVSDGGMRLVSLERGDL
jgi:hypothetical protein